MSELNQYLTFSLGKELFALDIGSVREILDDKDITPIPRLPEFMRGVINLRGHAVPVADLRMKLGMSRTQMALDTCVIITDVIQDGESIIIGVLADAVQEVIGIESDHIDPAPSMGMAVDNRFIKGMGKRNDCFVVILDIAHVFSTEDLASLAENEPRPSINEQREACVQA